MIIIYLHQYFNTNDMPGSTRSYELSKNLVENGHTVYLITSKRDFAIKAHSKKIVTQIVTHIVKNSDFFSAAPNIRSVQAGQGGQRPIPGLDP